MLNAHGCGSLHLDHLVDLFLIFNDRKARSTMVKNIGHFFRHRVLIKWNRNGTHHLGGDH